MGHRVRRSHRRSLFKRFALCSMHFAGGTGHSRYAGRTQQTFFSTTTYAAMPQLRNFEHYYEKRYNCDSLLNNSRYFVDLGNSKRQGNPSQKHGRCADCRHGPSVIVCYVFKASQFMPLLMFHVKTFFLRRQPD